jgi:PST family polysaccharide transporter
MVAPINAIVMAVGRQRLLFSRSLLILVVRLPVILGGLYVAGLQGMLVARVFSGGFVVVLFNAILVSQVIGISVLAQLRQVSRSLISVAVMALGVVAFQKTLAASEMGWPPGAGLIGSFFIGLILFVGTHIGLWLLSGSRRGPEFDLITIVTDLLKSGRRKVL